MAGRTGRFLDAVLDRVWPRVCAVKTCARPVDRDRRHLCSACFAGLPFHEADGCCRICGTTIVSKVQHDFVCEACAKDKPAYERARGAVVYEEPVDQLLNDFKFGAAVWLAEDLADLLEGAVRAKLQPVDVDVVVPVPLYPDRLRTRGYNQALLLAQALSRETGIPVMDILCRDRATAAQNQLSSHARRENLHGAFGMVKNADSILQQLPVGDLLLVDDIYTSGSTIEEAARTLRPLAGERKIRFCTLALKTAGGGEV